MSLLQYCSSEKAPKFSCRFDHRGTKEEGCHSRKGGQSGGVKELNGEHRG